MGHPGIVHGSVAEGRVPTVPCLASYLLQYNPVTECRLLVHGDDFVVLGDDDAQSHVEKALRTKHGGSIGVGGKKVLNSLVSFDERSGTISYMSPIRDMQK